MCDYSLESIASRPAKVGDKLMIKHFGTGTRGFCSVDDTQTAVCLLPGTELAFDAPVGQWVTGYPAVSDAVLSPHTVAKFIKWERPEMRYSYHKDAVEFPDENRIQLTNMKDGTTATVLQLPAEPLVEHIDLPAQSEQAEPAVQSVYAYI